MFMTKKLMDLGKKIIFALEGGYTIDTITRCSECVVRTLLFENKSFRNVMFGNYENLKMQIFNFLDNAKLSKIMKQFLNLFHM